MIWKKAPLEVKKYFHDGPRKAVSAVANTPYVVSVTFDDGITKEYDYSGVLTGVLSVICKPEIFCTVYIDDTNSIAWDTPDDHIR